IGQPVAETECRIVDENDLDVAPGERGELVMRGPQFMLGYWKEPQATASVLRDGWYWSGDVATCDDAGFYCIVDRRKEMIKYKGFPVAPAEVEAVLLEHPAVRDCGVVGKRDAAAANCPAPSWCCEKATLPAARPRPNSATLLPSALPATSSRAKSALWSPFPAPPRAKSCAANCASRCKAHVPCEGGRRRSRDSW